ncbi:21706_t:CDS:2, partial [Gigaspora rosea]
YGIYPPLNPYLVPYIYDYCEFWVLHFNRTDTWCSLLSEDDIIKTRYYWDMVNIHMGVAKNPFPLTANLTLSQIQQIKYSEAKTTY